MTDAPLPARKANSRYVAIHAEDLTRIHTFRLYPDGTGEGVGPTGIPHQRLRTWKDAEECLASYSDADLVQYLDGTVEFFLLADELERNCLANG